MRSNDRAGSAQSYRCHPMGAWPHSRIVRALPRAAGQHRSLSDASALGLTAGLLLLCLSSELLLTIGGPTLLLPILFSVVLLLTFRKAVPALLMTCWIFQNVAIAFWVTPESTSAAINTARALSFLVTAGIFAVISLELFIAGSNLPPRDMRLVRLGYLTLILIAGHTLVGITVAGPMGAIAYARNMSLLPIALIVGLVWSQDRGCVIRWFNVIFGALLIFGYAEMIFRGDFYTLIGFDEYLLRTTERALDIQFRLFLGFEQWLHAQRTVLFNDPLLAESGLTGIRLVGPVAHPISFGYAVVIASLPLVARAPIAAVLLQLPIHFGVNSKGALLLLLICFASRVGYRQLMLVSLSLRILALATIWGTVSLTAVVLGYAHGDFHVLGLFGGVKAFLANPIGHGLGTAGNLTEAGINGQVDFIAAQQVGLTRGIESAVAVLIDQLGIFCIPYLLLVCLITRRLLTQRDPLSIVLATAAAGLLANGLMQEEALFSPSSAGLLFLLAGLTLGRRQSATPSHPSTLMARHPDLWPAFSNAALTPRR